MQPSTTTIGIDYNFMTALAEIIGIAAREPGTLDDANEQLYAIADAAAKALFGRK